MNKKNSYPALVFVYLGKLPDYAKYSLILNARHNKIILLCDTTFVHSIQNLNVIDTGTFYNQNAFNNLADEVTSKFRGGFWFKTIERFFVLNAYMKHYNIDKLFHGEIDNLIFSLENISKYLDERGSGLFYPMLNYKIAGAALIYINSTIELDRMCAYFNAQKAFKDDMTMLAEYSRNSQNVFNLPSENNLSGDHFMCIENQNCIFDVASIGQYMFGVDLRNSGKPVFNKFQNTHCISDLSLMKFRINEFQNGFFLKKNDHEFKIINIHVHSKIFKKIFNDKNLILKIVDRINKGKKTLISLNVGNYKFIRNIYRYIDG